MPAAYVFADEASVPALVLVLPVVVGVCVAWYILGVRLWDRKVTPAVERMLIRRYQKALPADSPDEADEGTAP